MEPKDDKIGTSEYAGESNPIKHNLLDDHNLSLNAHLSRSPTIKSKNISKFNLLRSIFEPKVPSDHFESSVQTRTDCDMTTYENPPLESAKKIGDLSPKKRSTNGMIFADLTAKKDLIIPPNSRHIAVNNAVKLATTRSVVCRPNPEKSCPKKDIKLSSTPRENRRKVSRKCQAEQSQVGSIVKFLEVKNTTVRKVEKDGESNPKEH